MPFPVQALGTFLFLSNHFGYKKHEMRRKYRTVSELTDELRCIPKYGNRRVVMANENPMARATLLGTAAGLLMAVLILTMTASPPEPTAASVKVREYKIGCLA